MTLVSLVLADVRRTFDFTPLIPSQMVMVMILTLMKMMLILMSKIMIILIMLITLNMMVVMMKLFKWGDRRRRFDFTLSFIHSSSCFTMITIINSEEESSLHIFVHFFVSPNFMWYTHCVCAVGWWRMIHSVFDGEPAQYCDQLKTFRINLHYHCGFVLDSVLYLYSFLYLLALTNGPHVK